MSIQSAKQKVQRLPLWRGPVDPQPLGGGITNINFVVEDAGKKFVVRVGNDIPVHQVMRFNELAASQGAAACGISPNVVYHGEGTLILDFVDGITLDEAGVRDASRLPQIIELIKRCHTEMPKHVRGPILMFWVFHVLRDYAGTLRDGNSKHLEALKTLMKAADQLEHAIGPIDIVFGHNDLLPANFIDVGDKIWLIDWDYAGWNSPLFDLGGLASNNGLSETQEDAMLEAYYDATVTDDLRRRYAAMSCASLLRETLWSMVSEIHSSIDFDYSQYTVENRGRFERAYVKFTERF